MNILLIGPPGVGKGTQARFLTSNFDLDYITTGDLLRNEAKADTSLGNKIRDIISSGGLVPDTIVESLVVKSVSDSKKGILFDGFPRTISQAKSLEDILSSNDRKLEYVINMVLSDDILLKRISGRYVCAGCSAVYNKFFINTKIDGVCDHCSSTEFITRSDDDVEVTKKRLDIFHQENDKIVEYYRKKSLLVDICCNAGVEEVTQKISSIFNNVS